MSLPALTFECYQMETGVWCKRRANGLRGACVADEAILWQHLQAAQAALGQKPPPSVNIKELVRENEELSAAYERLRTAHEALQSDWIDLCKEAEELRANQRKKPGRKPRSDAAGAEDQAFAAIEQDALDEDL